MSSEGFLIGIDLHGRLKLCIFLMIFLNGYIDILKVDLFTVKKKGKYDVQVVLRQPDRTQTTKNGVILSGLRYKMQKSR